MISGVLLINLKGDIIIQRFYRDDIPPTAPEAFRQQIIAGKRTELPIVNIDGASFMYTRHNDVYIVTVTRLNANPMLAFQLMFTMVDVFTAYFDTKFTEDSLRNNFVLIYELLDEMMDFGYPQLTTVNHLKGAISLGSVKAGYLDEGKRDTRVDKITSFITGGVDWREPGKHVYKKNEVFMDVLEAVNVLVSADGTVLRADVSGKIVMQTYLTGMPECKFGMNDKLLMDKEVERRNNAAAQRNRAANTGVAIDDVTFHRCVQLTQFDQDRTISFIPPDGEFTLMKYRITQVVALPFSVSPTVIVHGRTRVEFKITIKANFDANLAAANVKMIIPVPTNAASAQLSVTAGSAKLKSADNCLQWKIQRFDGNRVHTLRAEVTLAASVNDKPWVRPPINLEFQVPMFTASGLRVRYLRVTERSGYDTTKWVRYLTRAGSYSIRI